MIELIIDRWLHVMFGIAWVGVIYYLNFIQVPAMKQAKSDGSAAGINRHIAPRVLYWFLWTSVLTWLTGAYYLEKSGIGLGNAYLLKDGADDIGIGAWLGTIMLFNVWAIIWPMQRKVLGIVEASDEEKAKSHRIALFAARTNAVLSVPMLFFMVAAPHGGALFHS